VVATSERTKARKTGSESSRPEEEDFGSVVPSPEHVTEGWDCIQDQPLAVSAGCESWTCRKTDADKMTKIANTLRSVGYFGTSNVAHTLVESLCH
jgi:hypothetical protein